MRRDKRVEEQRVEIRTRLFQSGWDPLDLLGARKFLWNTHPPLKLALHFMLEKTRPTVGTESARRGRGGRLAFAKASSGLAKPCRSLEFCVPTSLQSLWPATSLQKLELIWGIRYAFILWMWKARVSPRMRAQPEHQHIAWCHLSRSLLPAQIPAIFHRQTLALTLLTPP